MKKSLLLLLMVFMAISSSWAYTLPTSTMDLKTITASTMGTWQDQKSYDLSDDWLVVSGYASYKSVGKQTWITQTSVGNSANTWNTLSGEPFKGSSYYTTASYTTIQSGRNLVYRVKNCKSVKVYGKNNSSSKYLEINIYEVTDGTAATSAAYTLSNDITDEQVWNQTLDGNKEYVVDIEGVGTSNSRVFEVAFERNVVADTRKEPELSLSATEFEAHVGDAEFTEPTVSSAGGYTGSYTYSSDKPAIASVDATTGEVTIGSTAGVATITVSVPEGDANYKPRSVSYTIAVKKVAPVGATFYESFDQMNGSGGNDGIWSNITLTPALGTFDNTGWTTEGTNYSGDQCVSIRKNSDTSKPSGLTTPAIGVAGDGMVQFDAESWGSDGSNFFVDIVGGGTFVADENLEAGNITNEGTTAKVAMAKNGNWTTFTLQFEGLTADSKLRFYAPANKRAFLDEVAVFVTPTFASLDDLIAAEQSFDDVNVTINEEIFMAAADPEHGAYAVIFKKMVMLAALGEDLGWKAGGTVTGTLKNVRWQYGGSDEIVGNLMCPPTVWDALEYTAPKENPTFSSIEDLLDAELPNGTAVNVTINGTVKDTNYNESEKGQKSYSVLLDNEIVLASLLVDHNYGWEAGGTVSGTLEDVTYYEHVENGVRERGLVSMTKDIFAGLTYEAPTTATITLNAACTDGEFVYGTYSNKKAFVVPEDIIVYEVAVIDGCIMKEAYSTNAIVPANTGVLVAALEGGDFTVSLSNEEGESVLGEDNALRASGAGLVAEEMEEAGDNYYYRLTMQNGTKVGFWWGAADGAAFNIAANKAYLVAPKTEGQAAKGFALGDTTTLINAINASEKANGVAYNLAGQRVNANHKGIVIINGHKFINK